MVESLYQTRYEDFFMYYHHEGMESWPKVDYKGAVLSLGFKNPNIIGLEYLRFKVDSAEQIDGILTVIQQRGAKIASVSIEFPKQA